MKNIEVKANRRTLKGNCVVGKISWLTALLGKPFILDEDLMGFPSPIISVAVALVMLLLGFLI